MKIREFKQYSIQPITIREADNIHKIRNFIENNLKKSVQCLSLLILVIFSIFIFLFISNKKNNNQKDEDLFNQLLVESVEEKEELGEEFNKETEDNTKISEEEIKVDLKGAVQSPGVYEMENDQRVIDCINKAGGFLEGAEQKSVNLAERLTDQMVIYIPLKGENPVGDNYLNESIVNTIQANSEADKIDLNRANKEDLKSLNGIGDVKAENIISYREANGKFKSIEEILNISGIGEATLDKLKEEITVIP